MRLNPFKKQPIKLSAKEFREAEYNKMSEAWHQEQLIYWLDKRGIYYELSLSGIYLPNVNKKGSRAYMAQAKANAKVMSKMKKQGLNKGIADLKIYLPKVELNIELKSMSGRASKEQLEVQKIINKTKYARYEIVKGYLNAIELIEGCM